MSIKVANARPQQNLGLTSAVSTCHRVALVSDLLAFQSQDAAPAFLKLSKEKCTCVQRLPKGCSQRDSQVLRKLQRRKNVLYKGFMQMGTPQTPLCSWHVPSQENLRAFLV